MLDMKLLPITGWNNKKERKTIIIGYTKVDDNCYEELKKYKWNISGKKLNYVFNTKLGRLNRFIMNCPKDKIVDHKNGDTLDNRKKNLRICTYSQNSMNSYHTKRGQSGHRNVVWDKKQKKWSVIIQKDYKMNFFGSYESLKKAIMVANKNRKKLFGEFYN